MKLKSLLEKLIDALENWIERHVVARDPDDVAAEEAEAADILAEEEATDRIRAEGESEVQSPESEVAPPEPAPAEPAPAEPELDWCWGGVDGSKAAVDVRAQICSLRVSSSGMSYAWAAGGCEVFGAADKHDASAALACLFVWRDGKWKGGKFDWISTDRLTRDFANIEDGYNGWPRDAVKSSPKFAFCILGADRKRRTNVIFS